MTTAARPTFEPARGGSGRSENDLGAMSKQYSSRDLPGHTKLKYRQDGQNSASDVRNKDFRRELEDKERNLREKKKIQTSAPSLPSLVSKKSRSEQVPLSTLDADDPIDEDESDDQESDEDDSADLMAELAKIKKERAAEHARREAERKEEEERVRMENIIKGNPLLNQDKVVAEFKVKRRWDDDVVFKNCSRQDDSKKVKHYINDTLRSEFHKKFMDKYIK
ncbi:hypothetical protein HELRODRAFT_81330 [Helobdella robusta]|uniref:Uncharacterized protein n=1 Tax=Helobdella robusta TaxID=6412 RepID=T1G4D1_HELRO|nr:hypothetical protein HELRODRAFT_81330 [Helobdella robusta]ESO01602.1 hypothetical protein HELRODRAFT_81330 [Helobdella robusta]